MKQFVKKTIKKRKKTSKFPISLLNDGEFIGIKVHEKNHERKTLIIHQKIVKQFLKKMVNKEKKTSKLS